MVSVYTNMPHLPAVCESWASSIRCAMLSAVCGFELPLHYVRTKLTLVTPCKLAKSTILASIVSAVMGYHTGSHKMNEV